MPQSWKPSGYNTVSPYLILPNPESLIQFLKSTFDAIPLRTHQSTDGRIAHAEVRIGDSVVMMGDSGDGSFTPCHVHVYVEDVEATYKKALAAGGISVQAPVQKADSDKRGGVTDPTGVVTWWIGTQMA